MTTGGTSASSSQTIPETTRPSPTRGQAPWGTEMEEAAPATLLPSSKLPEFLRPVKSGELFKYLNISKANGSQFS